MDHRYSTKDLLLGTTLIAVGIGLIAAAYRGAFNGTLLDTGFFLLAGPAIGAGLGAPFEYGKCIGAVIGFLLASAVSSLRNVTWIADMSAAPRRRWSISWLERALALSVAALWFVSCEWSTREGNKHPLPNDMISSPIKPNVQPGRDVDTEIRGEDSRQLPINFGSSADSDEPGKLYRYPLAALSASAAITADLAHWLEASATPLGSQFFSG